MEGGIRSKRSFRRAGVAAPYHTGKTAERGIAPRTEEAPPAPGQPAGPVGDPETPGETECVLVYGNRSPKKTALWGGGWGACTVYSSAPRTETRHS